MSLPVGGVLLKFLLSSQKCLSLCPPAPQCTPLIKQKWVHCLGGPALIVECEQTDKAVLLVIVDPTDMRGSGR